MKKLILLLIILPLFFVGCNKSELIVSHNNCLVENALEEIEWIKETRRVMDFSMASFRQTIHQYTFKGSSVFIINECINCGDYINTVYDCEKNIVCEFNENNAANSCYNFTTQATNKVKIY